MRHTIHLSELWGPFSVSPHGAPGVGSLHQKVFLWLEPKCSPPFMKRCLLLCVTFSIHSCIRGKSKHFLPFLYFCSLEVVGVQLFFYQIKIYCRCEELEMRCVSFYKWNMLCVNLVHWYFHLWNHSSCCKEECIQGEKRLLDYLFKHLEYIGPKVITN